MRVLFFTSSGFSLATPAYDDDTGDVHIVLTPIVGFIPSPYDNDDLDDRTHTFVKPMLQDAVEHPEQQVVRRPDGWFIDPQGLIGSEAAVLERFRKADRRHVQRRPCRYRAALLLDYEEK
jgi:hypothetical protein